MSSIRCGYRVCGSSLIKTIILMGLLQHTSPSYAVDVSPGAYIPTPIGTNTAMLYLGGGKASEYHPERGPNVDHGTRLNTQTGLLRLFHMFDAGSTPLLLQVGIPFGVQKLKLGGAHVGEVGGFADPFFAVTAWPLNDPGQHRYLGITGYVFFPLGKYDHDRSLNLGNNRFAYTLQTGFSQAWDAWRLDLNGDVTWYGANDQVTPADRTLKQKSTYVLQPWLNYTFPNRVTTSFGLTRTWGGDSEVDGIDSGRRTDSIRARVGLGVSLRSDLQLYSEVTRDLQVDGGYKFDYSGFIRVAYHF